LRFHVRFTATKNFISAFWNLTPDVFLLKDGGARKTSRTSQSIPATLDNLLRGPADSENGVRLRHDGRPNRRKLNSRRSYIIPTAEHHENPPQNRNSRSFLFYKNFMGRDIRYEPLYDRGHPPCPRRELREVKQALR